MNYEHDLLTHPDMLKVIGDSIVEEEKRILNTNLATHDQLQSFNKEILSKSTDALPEIHRTLLAVKLPGDFERLVNIKESSAPIEKNEECVDCDVLDETSPRVILADTVNNMLRKLAYKCGTDGQHQAAYLIERTIHEIEYELKK